MLEYSKGHGADIPNSGGKGKGEIRPRPEEQMGFFRKDRWNVQNRDKKACDHVCLYRLEWTFLLSSEP